MKKTLTTLLLLATACSQAQTDLPFDVEAVASFDEPWAMAFLPDGRILVTEQKGRLAIVGQDGRSYGAVRNVPDVDYGGQGGFGDVVLHPDFDNNSLVYLSYAEAGVGGTRGAAVARGELTLGERNGTLSNVEVVWRQYPKTVGYGHYGHRIVFDDDGSVPGDNPFADYYSREPLVDDIGVYPETWSLGHRNPLGMTFDLDGGLWVVEMGPAGGDELNHIVRGGNYGYPVVSNGEHYDGRPMPDHDTRPDFNAPAVWWTPVISPGYMMAYDGDAFPAWRGDLLIAGLSSQAIIRIEVDGDSAREVERYGMGARIRSVKQGPDGALWALEDESGASQGRLLRLTRKD